MAVSADFDVVDEVLTLTSPEFLLQVEASAEELTRLRDIGEAVWTHKSLRIGTSLGHPVFWCAGENPDDLSVLVGPDDETWALALLLPMSLIDDITAAAQRG